MHAAIYASVHAVPFAIVFLAILGVDAVRTFYNPGVFGCLFRMAAFRSCMLDLYSFLKTLKSFCVLTLMWLKTKVICADAVQHRLTNPCQPKRSHPCVLHRCALLGFLKPRCFV